MIPRQEPHTALDGPQYYRLLKNQIGGFDGTFGSLTGLPTTLSGYGITDAQPHDADLDAIALLATTSYGRALLTKTDAADVRSYIGAGSSSFSGAFADLSGKPTTIGGYGITDFNSLGDARWQTLDADLTAIAALATTSFGRAFNTLVDAAASRTYIGAGTSSFSGAFSALTGIPTTIAGYGITDFNSLGDARWSLLAHTHTFASLTSKPTTLSGYGITDAQPLDTDLTTIAGLTATTDNFIVSVSSAWASRTPAQVRTTLGLVIGTNVQAWDTDLDTWAGISPAVGIGAFLATPSSLNLRAAVTDETGSGALVFATSPTLVTPLLGTPTSGVLTNCTGLPIAGLTGLGTNIATFLGATKPTTIGGYGITDFNSLGDARWQAADSDLSALAALSETGAFFWRQSAGTWYPVTIGPGLFFYVTGGIGKLTTLNKYSAAVATIVLPSASTLDLSAYTTAQIVEVTGSTNIDEILMVDGVEHLLRFTDAAPPTLIQGTDLQLLGGVDQPTTQNAQTTVRDIGSVVKMLDYQDAAGYSKETFGNIYMNEDANIGFSNLSSPEFDIGKGGIDPQGNYLNIGGGAPVTFSNRSGTGNFAFNSNDLTTGRLLVVQDRNGTIALNDGIGLKLGSLTTNGFVKTSGGDGTLSVDTATYLTSAAIGSTIQAYDADLTTWAGITPGAGVATFLATPSSANLRSAMTDESGSGALLFAGGALGTPASGTLTSCTGLPITTGLGTMATASLIYRKTAGTGAPEVNTLATLKTDLGTFGVAQGGTGATTLAAHGVVIGNGTSAVAVTGAGTTGQVLTSNGASADPTFQTPGGSVTLAFGQYSPTFTDISGSPVSSITGFEAQWSQVGTTVTVISKVDIKFDTILSPQLDQIEMSLPVPSVGTGIGDYLAGGSGNGIDFSATGLIMVPMLIRMNSTDGVAELDIEQLVAFGTSTYSFFFIFAYQAA